MSSESPLNLVVGSEGTLGEALLRRGAGEGLRIVGTSRRSGSQDRLPLDLSGAESAWVLPASIDTAFLLAGITNMAACEADPVGTGRVNLDATMALARSLARRGAHVVVVSTNLVLSGKQERGRIEDATSPQNVYAMQKAAVENALLRPDFPGTAAVIRITKIAGSLRPLLNRWVGELTSGRAIAPLDDLICAPMPVCAVTQALLGIGRARAEGLFQHGADEDISYTEIARMLAAALGCDPALVRGTTSKAAGVTLMANPDHTTLDDAQTREHLGLPKVGTRRTLECLISDIVAAGQRGG